MRFTQPKQATLPPRTGGGSSFRRPEWLREWIANKGRYCLMSCGHKTDLSVTVLLIVRDGHNILCHECDDWVLVEKGLSFNEYKGLPKYEVPDEPLF